GLFGYSVTSMIPPLGGRKAVASRGDSSGAGRTRGSGGAGRLRGPAAEPPQERPQRTPLVTAVGEAGAPLERVERRPVPAQQHRRGGAHTVQRDHGQAEAPGVLRRV